MLALAMPMAGCATFSHLMDSTPAPAPAKQAAAKPSLTTKSPQGVDVEVAVFLTQAQQARASGDPATASKLLAQLVLIAPDDPRVLGEYGKALVAQGRSDDALAFLQRAIEIQPGDWTLYSAQGVALDQETKFQAAQAAYGHALELKPGELAVLNNDALSHMQAGDLKGAEELLAQVSPQSPGYPQIAKTLALLETYKSGDHQKVAAETLPKIAEAKNEAPSAPAPAVAPLPPSVMPLAEVLPPPVAPVDTAPLPSPVKQEVALDATPASLVQVKTAPSDAKPALVKPAQKLPAPPMATASNYETLKADPTVVMAPLPVEAQPQAQPVRQAAVAKPAATPVKAADKPEAENAPQRVSTIAAGKPKAIPASLTTVKPEPENHSSSTPAKGVYVQAGSYLSEDRAKQASAGLESLDVKVMEATVNGREVFRLRIGPFATTDEAKAAFAKAQALGRSDLMIVREQ
jgi:DedD protein